jgi:MYXO-CTERM domain-containing protein
MRTIVTTGLTLAALLAFTSLAAADIWTEIGDAGDLPSTAQQTGFVDFRPLDEIRGTIDNRTDADMFVLYLPGGGTFSATTVGTPGTLNDTQLFLFDASGHGVYANDDANSSTRRSTLPADHPLTPQAAGLYYLAIAPFGRVPVSQPSNDVIFPDFPTTGVFGPTGPGGANPISGWRGEAPPQEAMGTYTIRLTGALTVSPEPGALTLAGLGLLGVLGYGWWRQRRAV